MDEPGAGVSPVILGSALGEAQSSGGFNVGHAHETTQFDHLCLNGVDGGELVERLVYGEELVIITRHSILEYFSTPPVASFHHDDWRVCGGPFQ